MKDDQRIEYLIKESLRAAHTPPDELNDALKKQMEENMMGKRGMRQMRIGVLAAALVVVFSVTAFAAWNLLSPANVAHELGLELLAKAFEGEQGIVVNESATAGDYRFTLLGIASGQGLSGFAEDLERDSTYSVMAVERLSGPMPAMSDDVFYEEIDDFLVSPLVKGIAPWRANIFTMGGSRSSMVIDGVLYMITQCDNVEMFAGSGVYLAVTTNSISVENFSYDGTTGEIQAQNVGSGINLLFNLPLDPAKADPAKARAYMDEANADLDQGLEGEPDGQPDGAPEDRKGEETPTFEILEGEDGGLTVILAE